MKELSQREAAFAVHFTTIGSDTFSDGKNSAIAAGYSERSAHVAASRLLKRERVSNPSMRRPISRLPSRMYPR